MMKAAYGHSESLGLSVNDYLSIGVAMVAKRHEINRKSIGALSEFYRESMENQWEIDRKGIGHRPEIDPNSIGTLSEFDRTSTRKQSDIVRKSIHRFPRVFR